MAVTNRLCSCLLALVLLLCPAAGATAAAVPDIKANAAILMDAKTGQVLYNKNMNKRGAPASTTKILTAILAIESGRLDEMTKVSVKSSSTPGSSMHLYPGQLISLRELVTGLLLRSGNDAAVAIAEHLAGSSEAFVDLMNQKAAALGALHSHFCNPNGLSAAGHYSTAFDLAWMSRYALSNPIFADIVNTKETTIEWLDKRGNGHDVNLRNTNKLLWMLDDADGVKTGTTGEAGPCLVSSATRGNQKLIAVVLHDHNRWYDSMQLLKYGFNAFDLYEFAQENEIVAVLPVEGGFAGEVDALVTSYAALTVAAEDFPHVTVKTDLPDKLNAPVYQGQKIGEIIFYVNDQPVKTVDIVAAQAIEERTLPRVLLNQLTAMFRLLSGWGAL
ncbi:D-alanyl-D-alanine carboxypeptidase family protein [Propionispora hippei]|uniref:serine-type D-Ala-D-Ala carboxypeptidase n=1 Tax=Propionispora hippei DSM 15287 TaxID=1123003 RepID=A0A1M6F5H0_9FIRM|nr:D-alanyl-D-alanine carboxypeptidase family protein [Propionispora hippei]SHI92906.1 D-alanyl-D-alanine carboxypeptidase (penicillin-binding protein 5/6) [Propionispora hippei DSM 15287]